MSVVLKNFNYEKQIYTFQCHFYNSLSTVCNVMYKMVIKVYGVTHLALFLRPDIDSSVSYLDDEKKRLLVSEWSMVNHS